ncbi:MAG: phytoene desaturase [Bdellovibrionales bacterium]|nr:phytoene desaturase [Bdellovibrionales bacterium]
MPTSRLKAAVIGSGFGGLAAAIRLQARGIDTTILEKRDKAGGRAYVFEDSGFHFDAGPTVITAPECIDELFSLCNRKRQDYVELLPVTPFYRLCWENGDVFDYVNDEAQLLEQIRRFNPSDVGGYQKFFKYSEAVFEAGYKELVHVPFLSFWDMIRAAPDLIKLKAYRSVYKTVASYIQNEKLRQAFSFHSLLIGGNPFSASAIYTLIHALERKGGVYFAKGGTHTLVRALLALFEEMGGRVLLNSEVKEIVTEQSKVCGVRTVNGEFSPYDLVVSNADVTHTYTELLRSTSEVKAVARGLLGKRYSQALFVVYFGTDRVYPSVAHHSILFCNRYKSLLEDIFSRGALPEENSFYLHAPCRTDSSLAPEGCDAFYVLANVPNLAKAPLDWSVVGPRYAEWILDYLSRSYLPEVKRHIVTQRFFSPLQFKTELNAHLGTAFSLEPTLLQSAYFRVHNRESRLKGLYFVGAGTHPGAGVPGVINSAKATVGVILSELRDIPEYRLEPAYA